jgi:carboxypeptidase Taq
MGAHLEKLKSRIQELRDLSGVLGLCTWDQETYLPEKAHPARAEQLSTLQGLYHERLVDEQVGEWIAGANAEGLDEDGRAMVRVFVWERDRARKVPADLVRALAHAQSAGVTAWRRARDENRFDTFAPALERLLTLRREQADALGHDGQRYDALLEGYEPGMRVVRLTPVLEALARELIPRAARWAETSAAPAPWQGRRFPEDAQWRFTLRLLRDMGFDFEAGRQDKSIHPFTGGTHPLDVRLTTKVEGQNPFPALFGSLHEGGHGLYEQGFREQDFRTTLAAAPSMGLHESQSRLWENLVGRSRPFWQHYYPLLQVELPEALGGVGEEAFFTQVNRVSRSLIRTEADEVTYNLHIVLRYQLELKLLSGDLDVGDLPGAWAEGMQGLLGITPRNDVEGVLQDIHWAWGELGYFPTYALGNLYAAALFAAARRAMGGLDDQLRRGQLLPLRDWLREQVHRLGHRLQAEDLIQRVTGQGLQDRDFISYLDAKFGAGDLRSSATSSSA